MKLGLKEIQDQKVKLELQVHEDYRAQLEQQESVGRVVLQDHQAKLDHQANVVHQDKEGFLVLMDH